MAALGHRTAAMSWGKSRRANSKRNRNVSLRSKSFRAVSEQRTRNESQTDLAKNGPNGIASYTGYRKVSAPLTPIRKAGTQTS